MRAVATIVFLVGACIAAEADERFGAFVLPDRAPNTIALVGDIDLASTLDFKRAIASRPDAEVVSLSSLGGSVVAGLLLADEIHLRGLDTYIPPQSGCYSACSYVFFAGAARMADGDLGVHQFYGESDDGLATAQMTMSEILDTLSRFETPQSVISRMLRTGPDDMYVFSEEEVKSEGINRSPKQVFAKTAEIRELPSGFFVAAAAPEEPSTVAAELPLDEDPAVFAIYEGVDFYGADIDKLRVDDFAACTQQCLDERICVAVTFNANPAITRGPNCFLKSSTGRMEPYEHAISGTFVDAGKSTAVMVGGERVFPVTTIPLEEEQD